MHKIATWYKGKTPIILTDEFQAYYYIFMYNLYSNFTIPTNKIKHNFYVKISMSRTINNETDTM